MKQFGEKSEGVTYVDRPGALAMLFDKAGDLGVVESRGVYFLPGGGIEEGESPHDALHREVAEEIGWAIEIGEEICRAGEYLFVRSEQKYFHKRGIFFLAKKTGEVSPIEECEHPFHWVTVETFSDRAAHQSHVWAVRRAIDFRMR